LHVDIDIDSTAPVPDGLAWETAYVSLQDALDQASVLNTDGNVDNDVSEIWIAEGTYKPTRLSNEANARSATFSMLDGVSLYGGFFGDEPNLIFRHGSETVLSGDLDASGDLSDGDAYCVCVSAATDVTLDMLTITGGSSGGISNYGEGVLSVINSTISGNSTGYYGGGIFNLGTLIVTNSTISGNSADRDGGGIYNDSGTVSVTNSIISGNSAGDGGGIYSRFAPLTVTNSTIAFNSARSFGGIGNVGSTLTLGNSIVAMNEATYDDSHTRGLLAADVGFNLIGADPGFVQNPTPGADGLWATEDDTPGDFRLTAHSPAINMGKNALLPQGLTVDADGNPRIFGQRTDIGAYEYQANPAPGRESPSTLVTTSADTVDFYDGIVSLREAVLYADTAGESITFDESLDGQESVLAGAAIYLDRSVTIDASGLQRLTINGDGKSGVFVVHATDVALKGLTITGGDAVNYGGGICNYGTLTVSASTISGSSATYEGGGIYSPAGELTLIGSTVSNNSAGYSGGGICVAYSGTKTIVNSIISGNSAGHYGGGIYITHSGTAIIVNSTISGNTGSGGGIYSYSHRTLTVTSSTISGNFTGGIEIYNDSNSMTLTNSIVAMNRYGYSFPLSPESDFNLINVDPGFVRNPGPGEDTVWGTEDDILGDYRLRLDSPAIDAGSVDLLPMDTFDLDNDGNMTEPIPLDIAGKTRVNGDSVDIGAWEASVFVVAQHVFYNNSEWDGYDPTANDLDDKAIAPDKRALLIGQTATFANYTTYDKGINGVMVDLLTFTDADLLDPSEDFEFRVGNNLNLDSWSTAPEPSGWTVRKGEGVDGSDRITFVWADRAIEKQWLRVTVKATDRTGLAGPDVFFFGNAPGEAGDQVLNTIVNATDEIVARNFQHSAVDEALVDDPYDYNRDGLVNGTDQIIARNNQTNPLTMLKLLSPVEYDVVSFVPEDANTAYWIPGESDADSPWNAIEFPDNHWDGTGASTIVITEAGRGTPDYIEIHNVSDRYVDTTGWVVAVNIGTSGDVDQVHDTYWHLGETIAPGEILYRTDNEAEEYFGTNIFWGNTGAGTGWAMILDQRGDVVDFLPWNYSVEQIAAMDTTINGFSVTGDGLWAGETVPNSNNSMMTTVQRIGDADHDTAEDFVFTTDGSGSRGAANQGLTTPFVVDPDQLARTGIGYSADPGDFGDAIRTDVGSAMLGVNASMWIRTLFEVDNPASLDGLTLRMQYNDGFVAYLNGREIARRNAPESLQWNSTATAERTIQESLRWDAFDVTPYIDELLTGTNVLAVHGLNASIDDDEFLIVPQLDGVIAGQAKSSGPIVDALKLDWQYEFESMQSKHSASKRRSDVEATVDLLLATGVE